MQDMKINTKPSTFDSSYAISSGSLMSAAVVPFASSFSMSCSRKETLYTESRPAWRMSPAHLFSFVAFHHVDIAQRQEVQLVGFDRLHHWTRFNGNSRPH